MATNYTQRKAALDEIAERITSQINALERAKQEITAAETALNGLSATYGAIIGEINQAANGAPGDGALQVQKNEAAKLVEDYQAVAARATALKGAVANI